MGKYRRMDCTDLKTELAELQALFAKAEARCKKVEVEMQFGGAPVIPAINELRYAGQHIIEACNSEDPTFQAMQINKAKNHCARAIYDATEAAILLSKAQFEEFKIKYSEIIIGSIVTNYSSYLQTYGELKQLIGSRRSDESKVEHYEQLVVAGDAMDLAMIALTEHEEELKKALAIQVRDSKIADKAIENSSEIVNQGNKRIQLTVVAIVLTTIGLFFGKGILFGNTSDTKQAEIPPPVKIKGNAAKTILSNDVKEESEAKANTIKDSTN